MNKYIKDIVGLFLIILFITIVLIKGLIQNIASEPFSLEKMFSQENIVDTLITTVIISIIVIPLKLLWDWDKGKKHKNL